MAFWTRQYALKKRNREKNNHGFSLIELIIVIAIIAILSAAIAPALIRYIDKSRKAIDIENAMVLFKGAEMAATIGSDDAAAGWGYAASPTQNKFPNFTVTASGHNSDFDKSKNTYVITCIAFARGMNYQSANSNTDWENAKFKCTANGDSTEENNVRQYTNEFLNFVFHEGAKDETYHGDGNNTYDGFSEETVKFKYTKDPGHGAAEIWMICVNRNSMAPEIWIGDKNINGRGAKKPIHALYRIYPNPCEEYTN